MAATADEAGRSERATWRGAAGPCTAGCGHADAQQFMGVAQNPEANTTQRSGRPTRKAQS